MTRPQLDTKVLAADAYVSVSQSGRLSLLDAAYDWAANKWNYILSENGRFHLFEPNP